MIRPLEKREAIVLKSKNKGGLGVLNLRLRNDDLLLKHLHKFYNKGDIPWVHLIWDKYYRSKVLHATREVVSFLVERCPKT